MHNIFSNNGRAAGADSAPHEEHSPAGCVPPVRAGAEGDPCRLHPEQGRPPCIWPFEDIARFPIVVHYWL